MWVSRYVVWFLVYSVLGWMYESTYCTIVERKWANRGFLYGPLCPIYGFGVIGMIAVWQLVQAEGISVSPWQVFVVTALGTAVLEYLTSWALEKLFHARWWDYTDMPLNVNGRICLPATVLFGLMGLLVVYVLYQPTMDITNMAACAGRGRYDPHGLGAHAVCTDGRYGDRQGERAHGPVRGRGDGALFHCRGHHRAGTREGRATHAILSHSGDGQLRCLDSPAHPSRHASRGGAFGLHTPTREDAARSAPPVAFCLCDTEG